MITGKMTQQDKDIIEQIRNMQAMNAKGREPFKPRPRLRRPWLGAVNKDKHKRKMADRRKARNKQARKSRQAQRRVC